MDQILSLDLSELFRYIMVNHEVSDEILDTIDRESQSWWAWAKRVGWNIVTFGGLWSYLWDKLKSCLTSRLCIGATALILTVVGCMWRASIQCQETEETQCNLYDTAVTTYDMISTFMGKYWFEFKSLISEKAVHIHGT